MRAVGHAGWSVFCIPCRSARAAVTDGRGVACVCVQCLVQEDKKVKDRVDSRNGLEGYCYNLKNMMEDDEKGLTDKLSAEEKETIEKAVQETLDWVSDNQEAEAEEFMKKSAEIGTGTVWVLAVGGRGDC